MLVLMKRYQSMLLAAALAVFPLAAQSSKDAKKSTEKQAAADTKKSGGDKSATREKIKASSGDEAGTAKGTVKK